MTDDPVESADFRAIGFDTGWLPAIVLLPVLVYVVFLLGARAVG